MPLKAEMSLMNAFEGMHVVVPMDYLMVAIQLLLVVAVGMHSTLGFNLLNITKLNTILLYII